MNEINIRSPRNNNIPREMESKQVVLIKKVDIFYV